MESHGDLVRCPRDVHTGIAEGSVTNHFQNPFGLDLSESGGPVLGPGRRNGTVGGHLRDLLRVVVRPGLDDQHQDEDHEWHADRRLDRVGTPVIVSCDYESAQKCRDCAFAITSA